MNCTRCNRPTVERNIPELGTQIAICNFCGHTITKDSVLKRFLNERIKNATDYGEIDYLSNQSPQLFTPNTLTFVGASMGVGKTYAVFLWGKENHKTTVILVPRVSLAMSLYKTYKHFGSVSCWCSASQRDDRNPRRLIHIATPPMLPSLIGKLDSTPNIAIDEIDFFDNLVRADILSKNSRGIKQILREHADTGILTLGQTAFTQEMQLFADEIGIPLKGIYATKKNPNKHNCNIEKIIGEHGKSTVIRKTVEKAIEILNQNKHIYIFADGRKTAHIIRQKIDELTQQPAIVYDRYTRGSEENQELIKNQELNNDKRVFISSNAVDVGISFTDKNAEVIVCTTENLARIGSARSLMQRALRNRIPCPIYIYTYIHNTTPLLPKKYKEIEWNRNTYHATDKLAERDATLIERHALVKSLNELASIQIGDFLEHHAPIAGIDINSYKEIQGDEQSTEWVHQLAKKYQDDCEENMLNTAIEMLEDEFLWSDTRIAKEGALGRMTPQPYTQLSHEMLNELGRSIGWDGEGCQSLNMENTTSGIFSQHHANSNEMLPTNFFPLLRKIITEYQEEDNELPNYKTLIQQKRGFTRLHTGHSIISGTLVPSDRWDNYTYEANPDLESIHNTDDRLQTEILFQIIRALRNEDTHDIIPEKEAINRIQKALETKYNNLTLIKHMERGHLGTQAYQASLTFKDTPETHINFAYEWISNNYPATLTRYRDTYKLARKSYWQLCKEMAEVQFQTQGIPFRFLHEDWFDFSQDNAKQVTEQVIGQELNSLTNSGMNVEKAAEQLGIGRDKAYKLNTNTEERYNIFLESNKLNGTEPLKIHKPIRKEAMEQLNISERQERRLWRKYKKRS